MSPTVLRGPKWTDALALIHAVNAVANVRYVLRLPAISVSLGLCFQIKVAAPEADSLNLPSFSLFLSIASENARQRLILGARKPAECLTEWKS